MLEDLVITSLLSIVVIDQNNTAKFSERTSFGAVKTLRRQLRYVYKRIVFQEEHQHS